MWGNEILRFDASAVGLEVKEQFIGCDAIVEGGGVLEILVIGLVNTITDELDCTFLSDNIRVVILEEEGVGGLNVVFMTGVALSWMVRLYAVGLGGRTNA